MGAVNRHDGGRGTVLFRTGAGSVEFNMVILLDG